MENGIINEEENGIEENAQQTSLPEQDSSEGTTELESEEAEDHNADDEHMQIDEEGVEIDPDDQV